MNIGEIKLENLCRGDFRGKSIFSRPKMLIYANWLESDAADLNFFFLQKKCNYHLGNYKNYQPKILWR